jgi:hypothetical protein
MHGLPSVRQVVLSAAHLPLVHLPPQHWPSCVHAPLSAVHASWHTLPTQLTEQQSVFAEHDAPACEHCAAFAAHMFVVVSHDDEQQSALPVQP